MCLEGMLFLEGAQLTEARVVWAWLSCWLFLPHAVSLWTWHGLQEVWEHTFWSRHRADV